MKDHMLIEIPFPIQTPRLILRNVLPGDGEAMAQAQGKSFKELNKWMNWAKEPNSVEKLETVARENHAKFIRREDIMILGFSKENGELLIATGLHRMDWDLRIFEIGYWVSTPHAGQGYATESTNALIRYAFGALSASKVIICHVSANDASRRVIEKLGFIKEGVFKNDGRMNDGTITDRHWYARFDTEGLPDLETKW